LPWSNDLDLSGTNAVTCSCAKDITFKNAHMATEKNPFVEDQSQNIWRIGWTEATVVPATQSATALAATQFK